MPDQGGLTAICVGWWFSTPSGQACRGGGGRVGRVLGSESFAADESGYGRMVAWFRGWGALVRVGVEGCGSYGAGLARYLTAAGIEVVEVNRPNRQLRRQKGGKSDSVDAEATSTPPEGRQVRQRRCRGDISGGCLSRG